MQQNGGDGLGIFEWIIGGVATFGTILGGIVMGQVQAVKSDGAKQAEDARMDNTKVHDDLWKTVTALKDQLTLHQIAVAEKLVTKDEFQRQSDRVVKLLADMEARGDAARKAAEVRDDAARKAMEDRIAIMITERHPSRQG